jgi:preprotein translocase subunit SecA
MNSVWADFARLIFHVQVTIHDENGPVPPPPQRIRPNPASSSATGGARVSYSGGAQSQPSAVAMAAAAGGGAEAAYADQAEPAPQVQQRRVDDSEQIGRNDPCWCGSGKKFKKCHGA